MASGRDPRHVLPAVRLRAGRVVPESERDTDRQPPACPETSQEFAFAAAKQLPPGFYSSFDTSRVK